MPKLITASCFILFWVFYEMSGGADFAPRERVVVSQAPFERPTPRVSAFQTPVVTNAAFTPIETVALPTPAVAIVQEETVTAEAIEPDEIETVAAIEEQTIPIVTVSGNRVNLREGPGTDHQVLNTLPLGTTADLIAVKVGGWAQIRLTETGQIGWMTNRLLSDG